MLRVRIPPGALTVMNMCNEAIELLLSEEEKILGSEVEENIGKIENAYKNSHSKLPEKIPKEVDVIEKGGVLHYTKATETLGVAIDSWVVLSTAKLTPYKTKQTTYFEIVQILADYPFGYKYKCADMGQPKFYEYVPHIITWYELKKPVQKEE